MQFSRLRISGFKSFIDPTEMWIEPGLTGIVGPNGCGKSNLVDALRWVMGETSPRQMRGGEMDDVIFAGTAARPARNLAEVTLHLDNGDRRAPAPFNDADEIEVTRRIDRGTGSTYYINGREVRARDVQLLFADAATGAHSTALVSQGHIEDLIKARPADRRAILEEAAGITGLHSRRHEAELRLRGAEANLARLDDVLATLEAQLGGLKRQARQAARYRRIGDLIRRAEAIQLHLRWREATAAVDEAEARLRAAEAEVVELTARAAAASTAEADAAERLPGLRRHEAEAASRLQRLTIEREALEADEARLARAVRDCEARIEATQSDIAREQALKADALAALSRIAAEEQAIAEAQADEAETLAESERELQAATAAMAGLERELAQANERVAEQEARRAGLERRIADCEARLARLAGRAAELARESENLANGAPASGALEAAEAALAAAQGILQERRGAAEAAQAALFAAQAAEAQAREAVHAAESVHARLDAEASALARLLAGGEEQAASPVIDHVTVESGYELALAAALGDDLSAPAGRQGPVRWDPLPPYPSPAPLPTGAEPLSRFVRAPAALARRLSQIGVVATAAQGLELRAQLREGQRLVTRGGGLWRWDGFTVEAGALGAAAERLAQRNRLAELRAALPAAQSRLAEEQARLAALEIQTRAAAESFRAAQAAASQAEGELDSARARHAELLQRAAAFESRRAAIAEADRAIASDRAEAQADLDQARAAAIALPPSSAGREELAALQRRLSEALARFGQCQSTTGRLRHDSEARGLRLAALAAERRSWQARAEDAERQLATLDERLAACRAEAAGLAARPQEIAAARNRILDEIAAAEAARAQAASRLAEAEAALAAAVQARKREEAALAASREARVRAEAQVEQAEQARVAIIERIAERLQCAPEAALSAGGIASEAELPGLPAIEARLERLLRERDNMGPVNLRAEAEAVEIERQIATLRGEREDLVSAIARLRQGIGNLNREGRERLLAAFATVDWHFQELFVRLFGGGRAHMRLTEAEDPLDAGLEIYASPPGKRLQVLSLLSGGEQALTALALLFAVFLSNPAPICVLDEVDAPLDDANTERFCNLVEEFARSSTTRFLVVTHQRLTMARMDRLFGVTMTERGVSQLVSVDLADAERMRATA